MNQLVVIAFPDELKADDVLGKLQRLQKEHLIDLEDACVVIRKSDGTLRMKQMHNLTAMGAVGGGMWGALLGLLFLNPLLGLAAGTAAGALSGALTDFGIDDDFIQEVGKTIAPGSSAIFVLVRRVTVDKVIGELSGTGGRVLRSSLSTVDEKKLQAALDRTRSALPETAGALFSREFDHEVASTTDTGGSGPTMQSSDSSPAASVEQPNQVAPSHGEAGTKRPNS